MRLISSHRVRHVCAVLQVLSTTIAYVHLSMNAFIIAYNLVEDQVQPHGMNPGYTRAQLWCGWCRARAEGYGIALLSGKWECLQREAPERKKA